MNNNNTGWITAGCMSGFLIFFVLFGGFLYSDVKRQLAEAKELSQQTQAQLEEKNQVLGEKAQTINSLETQKTDLEIQRKDLSSDLEEKKKKLNQKLAEVKKLQTDKAVLGECLIGVVGVLDAIKNEDREKAFAGLLMIDNSCRKSSSVLKTIEKFPIENEF